MSALFNPGVGGSPGGPSTPTPYEMSVTAGADAMKMAVGLTVDSMERAFTQYNPTAVWKYLSTSTRPLLPPIIQLRANMSQDKPASLEIWKKVLQELVQYLPADVKARLFHESTLPKEQRDESYGVLDQALGWAASLGASLTEINQPMSADQAAATRIPHYQALFSLVNTTTQANGAELIAAARGFLDSVGNREPKFDLLSSTLTGMTAALKDFEAVGDDKAGISKVAQNLDALHQQMLQLPGDNLQILRPMISALKMVTDAASLTAASPSLSIGLNMASVGLNASQSGTGLISSSMEKLMQQLNEGFIGTTLQKATQGDKELFPLLTNLFLLTSAALPTALRGVDERSLATELMFRFVVQSNVLQTISQGIAWASGAHQKGMQTIGDSLDLLATLIGMDAIANQNKEKILNLATGIEDHLKQVTQSVNDFVGEVARDAVSDSIVHHWNVLLQQASNALDAKDLEALVDILEESGRVVDETHTQDQRVKESQKELKDFVANLWKYTGEDAQSELNIQSAILQSG